MRYRLIATDFDGTIATDGVVPCATVTALQRAKAAGMALVLDTGRDFGLLRIFRESTLFDRLVLENGAVIYEPATGTSRVIAPPPPPALLDRLHKHNIPLGVGKSIVATIEPHQHAVLQAIHDLGLDWQVILNKGAVMALPSGVNKASGFKAVLQELQIPAEQAVAVGDAENDIAFLQAAGFPVAVANALPSVKAVARWVTRRPAGEGVVELIEKLLSE
jgi:hypothetical protein